MNTLGKDYAKLPEAHKPTWFWVPCWLAIALCSVAWAQFPTSQDGHILDANRRIGSSGLNSPSRVNRLTPPGNLYITGNVTGGARFQGLVPYRSTGEINATLGSGALSDFRRDSVGLDDLSSGLPGRRPYFDPSRSVTYTHNGRVTSTDQTYYTDNAAIGTVSTRRYANRSGAVRPLGRADYSLSVPSDASAFYGQPAAAVSTQPQSPFLRKTLRPGRRTAEVPDQWLGQHQQQPLKTAPDDQTDEQSEFDTRTPFEIAQDELEQLAEQQPETTSTEADDRQATTQPDQPRTPISVRATARRSATMSSYHRKIAHGKQYMKHGQFYRAASAFGIAATAVADGTTEMSIACYGKAHALFAAGEFMSAAFFLDRAITSDTPESIPIVLPDQVSDAQQLQKSLIDLQQWQQRSGQPMLLFLQGYVQYQLGMLEPSRQSLTQALTAQPEVASVKFLLNAVTAAVQAKSAPPPADDHEPTQLHDPNTENPSN